MCQQGGKFSHSQGENTQGGVCPTKFHLNVECMHSYERLHLFGVCLTKFHLNVECMYSYERLHLFTGVEIVFVQGGVALELILLDVLSLCLFWRV
jgi:hypothetical protein